jgi:pimeloyl-ACP methyl ester carboxylesterase
MIGLSNRIIPMATLLAVAGISSCAQSGLAQQAATGTPAAREAKVARPLDPRVQQRAYDFAFPGSVRVAYVNLPYAVFVSSRVTKDRKNPLIIALHGLGGNPNTLMRGNLLDLAEAGGYIVFAPAGYNPRGWYGIPWTIAPSAGVALEADPAAINDPKNLTQLSEKDVMSVLAIARRAFNVDERRTYLMGHSMGGAGALYLGSRYASNWAAVAAVAPAAQRMESDMDSILAKLTMPVLMLQGDADMAVPVENTRKWIAAMEERKMDYKYNEVHGGDHDSVIATGMPDIFAFFNAHAK